MENKKVIVLLLIIIIVLIGIIYNLLNKNVTLVEERQILKEMSTSERETELNNEITELNNAATEYTNYIQKCKAQIAEAITAKGVTTNETDTVDVMVENIQKIGSGYQYRTLAIYMAGVADGSATCSFANMSGYQNMTVNDFIVTPSAITGHNNTGWWGGQVSVKISGYNASTGIVTVSWSGSIKQEYLVGVSVDVVVLCKGR